MDAALWGIVVGLVLLAAGRAVWLQLRRGKALQEQEPDPVLSAVLPEEVGGLEGYLLRFFAEAELSWTPIGALGGLASLIAFLYLLAAIVDLPDGWFLFLLVFTSSINLLPKTSRQMFAVCCWFCCCTSAAA